MKALTVDFDPAIVKRELLEYHIIAFAKNFFHLPVSKSP